MRFLLGLLVLAVAPAVAQPALIPMPVALDVGEGTFEVTGETPILVAPDDSEAARIGAMLADLIGTTDESTPSVGYADLTALEVDLGGAAIRLVTDAGRSDLEAEGYELAVSPEGTVITAATPAGLFYGVQTFRQLLPARVEYTATLPASISAPAVTITDAPRFEWRGMMLDVARHFFPVEDVERVIDLMAMYKLNRLHLHLSDDQGWRIEIPGRPALTEIGSLTQVGGGPGGFYTVEDYEHIVRYAADRFITVVPEIDLPGHTNAALASIPELNCDGVAREPYTGTRVGFSTVCVGREETYTFVDDVVRELAAMTPGDEIHLGGDEVHELPAEDYQRFVERAQAIVTSHGKRFVGWDEVALANLEAGAIVQVWRPQSRGTAASVARAVGAGATVVLSPADRIYLDIKYDSTTVLGLTWAGINSVRDAYEWDPSGLVEGVPDDAIRGVEAPLWTETIGTVRDIEFMAFPRLAGVAEIGWSPRGRDWEEYRLRLAAHGPRWTALGISFFRAPEISWPLGGVE
ncbi:beta-N-acetylhexosaminidase [Rubrivirga sp.]|uniref:beta-N-acetylhexosaminidase n=1 Tax=Rubrivirga sp. TaxID=1885344 RepID=UPI003C776289